MTLPNHVMVWRFFVFIICQWKWKLPLAEMVCLFCYTILANNSNHCRPIRFQSAVEFDKEAIIESQKFHARNVFFLSSFRRLRFVTPQKKFRLITPKNYWLIQAYISELLVSIIPSLLYAFTSFNPLALKVICMALLRSGLLARRR